MSSVKKAKKNKSELENKIPPKNLKTDINKNTSKIPSRNKDNIKVTNEPIEKEMLKGQEHENHIEEAPKDENENINDKEINNNENINDNKEKINNNEEIDDNKNEINDNQNEEQENIINKNEEKKEKEVIQFKPRESYLKEKMMKLNYSEKLLNKINKSLDTEVQKIHDEIIDDQILITAVPQNLIKKKLISVNNNANTTEQKNLYEKSNIKILNELKKEEEQIKQNLYKIIENEKLIKDESLNKIYSLKQSQSNLSLDKILKIEKLKNLNNQKEKLQEQLNDIEFKINEMMGDKIKNETSRKNKLKTFLSNFERDKEIAETRAKKYFQEFKEVNKRKKKDMKEMIDKFKKEMEEKENEDKKKKLDLLQEFIKKERAIEQKRYNEYMKKALEFKNFILEKPKLKLNDYLYNKKLEKFYQERNNALRLENSKRKEMMKSISKEEFKSFALNYDLKKEKMNNNKEEKKIKLTEEWRKRRNLLPTYISCFSETAKVETKNKEKEEILKTEKRLALIDKKKKYCKNIKEEKQPSINKKLQQIRLDEISRLNNPKEYFIKNPISPKKSKRIILKKRDPEKPSKFKWKLKLEVDPLVHLNNSDTSNDILIKRPKRIKMSTSFDNKKNHPPAKKIDYLKQLIFKNEHKKSMSNKNIFLTPKNSAEKWEKIINKFKGNFATNVNKIQKKVDVIDREAFNKEKKLKLEGGIGQNPELGQEVSNLLIDSIEAKLSILNKLAEMQ